MSSTAADAPAYNTAYVADDRSHLCDEFGVDPDLAAGREVSESDRPVAPADLEARRRATLSFYGHRCGRCARPVATRNPVEGETLGFAFSVGRVADADQPWALEELVAVCEPCLDLLEPGEAVAVGTVATRYREAPQFPAWHCDPRVAVERVPFSGRELFRREWLAGRVAARFDFGRNDAVAEHAVLALDAPAARAVAFGEAVLAARMGVPARDPSDPDREWEACSPTERRRYRQRVLSPRSAAVADRPWRTRWEVALEDAHAGADEPAGRTDDRGDGAVAVWE